MILIPRFILSFLGMHVSSMIGLKAVIEGSDHVMHLAGMISYLQKDYMPMLEVNQSYTANIVNACLSTSVKKLLYCSSIAAITKNSNGELITEDVVWNNEVQHSNYGYTKHLGEYELWRAQEEGLDAVAINPGIILGYGDWNKGSNTLFKNAAKSFPFFSEGITGWVGVQDVAQIAEKLCISDISRERFILVSENLSFKEVADTMCDKLGSRKPWIEIKGILFQIAYGIVWVKELFGIRGMLSKETVCSSVAVNYFSNRKIKEKLNYDFESIKTVISKAAQYYRL